MTIYPAKAAPFRCAICDREGPPQWDHRERTTVAPLCYRCERDWGGGGGLAARMDHRLARQIRALAEVIACTAHCQQHGNPTPYGH